MCLCHSIRKSNLPRPLAARAVRTHACSRDRPRSAPKPDAGGSLPTPTPLGRKQALIGANECDAHYVTTRRTMDASTATPGSPRTMPACPPFLVEPAAALSTEEAQHGPRLRRFPRLEGVEVAKKAPRFQCTRLRKVHGRGGATRLRGRAREEAPGFHFAMWRQGAARAPDGAGGDAEPGEAGDVGLVSATRGSAGDARRSCTGCPSTPSTYQSTSSTATGVDHGDRSLRVTA